MAEDQLRKEALEGELEAARMVVPNDTSGALQSVRGDMLSFPRFVQLKKSTVIERCSRDTDRLLETDARLAALRTAYGAWVDALLGRRRAAESMGPAVLPFASAEEAIAALPAPLRGNEGYVDLLQRTMRAMCEPHPGHTHAGVLRMLLEQARHCADDAAFSDEDQLQAEIWVRRLTLFIPVSF